MARIAWGSLALGVVLGAASATGALLFVTVGPAEERSAPGGDEAPVEALPAGTSTAGSVEGPSAGSDVRAEARGSRAAPAEDAPRLVTWLSERLQEAYRLEALPEIIGSEAGAEAADQVAAYVAEADDTDTVHDQLSDVFDRAPADLGLEGWEIDVAVDCDPAPCVFRVDMKPPGGDESLCGGAWGALSKELEAALQPGRLSGVRGGCDARAIALSGAAAGREDEINAGIEGFIDNYFDEAKKRAAAIE